ncbi:MAG TPA: methyltransferase [Methanocorpusculum sp.]|nr:methyltransferase [Methanocorpusculum sp.]
MLIDTDQIYKPSDDTFLLLRAALNELKSDDCVLEMGCGYGEISFEVMKHVKSLKAIDINPHAVNLCRSRGIDAALGDLFDGVTENFDLILFNAPYLPTKPDERIDDWLEFALDGGLSGRDTVDRFLTQAASHLNDFGRILLLISSLTDIDEVLKLCKSNSLIAVISETEIIEDGDEVLYVLRISRDLCSV